MKAVFRVSVGTGSEKNLAPDIIAPKRRMKEKYLPNVIVERNDGELGQEHGEERVGLLLL